MKSWLSRFLLFTSIILGQTVFLTHRALAEELTVVWPKVIGIIQAGNVVGGITGGGQPWATLEGTAVANLTSGHIRFRVVGLTLAGGNALGTPNNVTQVKGTLVCNPGASDQASVDTSLVPLSAVGDAVFDGAVEIPPSCLSSTVIAFLVRNASGAWIANGIAAEKD